MPQFMILESHRATVLRYECQSRLARRSREARKTCMPSNGLWGSTAALARDGGVASTNRQDLGLLQLPLPDESSHMQAGIDILLFCLLLQARGDDADDQKEF